jgi:hypothetical protein
VRPSFLCAGCKEAGDKLDLRADDLAKDSIKSMVVLDWPFVDVYLDLRPHSKLC